jgi:hypothetical protein
MWQVWGRGEVHTESWLGNLRKRPLGRPGDKCEDNIKMDLQDIGSGGQGNDSSGSRQEVVAGSHKHGNKPWLHKVQEFLDKLRNC